MRKGMLDVVTLLSVLLTLSLAVALGGQAPDVAEPEADIDALAAPITRSCTFGASGDGCVFDVVATGGGNLQVDTRASVTGERWRTTIAIVGTKTVLSNVGTGSTNNFTGLVQRSVANGKSYNVAVLYEGPLPGAFPTTVAVRFRGTALDQNHVTITGPRPGGNNLPPPPPGLYAGVYSPFAAHRDFFLLETSADGTSVTQIAISHLVCGAVLHEHFFSLNVSIPIMNGRFAAQEIPFSIGNHIHHLSIDGVFFDADASGSSLEQALGGFSFLDNNLTRCNHPWRATIAADADGDGWGNTAESRLSSDPGFPSGSHTPEHSAVPEDSVLSHEVTPLYGPHPCHDFVDNDGDGDIDGADQGCQ